MRLYLVRRRRWSGPYIFATGGSVKRAVKSAIGLGAVGLALLTVTAPGAQAEPTSPHRTEAQIAAMDPTQRGELLEPLRQLANAVDAAGQSKQSDTYAGVRIDAPSNVVHVYVTDPSRTAKLIEAARQADTGVDTRKIVVQKVRYTLDALHDARAKLFAKAAPRASLRDPLRGGQRRSVLTGRGGRRARQGQRRHDEGS